MYGICSGLRYKVMRLTVRREDLFTYLCSRQQGLLYTRGRLTTLLHEFVAEEKPCPAVIKGIRKTLTCLGTKRQGILCIQTGLLYARRGLRPIATRIRYRKEALPNSDKPHSLQKRSLADGQETHPKGPYLPLP